MKLISDYQNSIVFKDSILFEEMFGDSVSLINEPNTFISLNESYTFVLTWASFAGKLNSINTKKWADSITCLIKKNKDVEAVFVNLDLQKQWDFNTFNKKSFKIESK
jgi:hypothetical protein